MHAQPRPAFCQVPSVQNHSYPVQHGSGGWHATSPEEHASPSVGEMQPPSAGLPPAPPSGELPPVDPLLRSSAMFDVHAGTRIAPGKTSRSR